MVAGDKVSPIWDNRYSQRINTFGSEVVSKTFSKNHYAIS